MIVNVFLASGRKLTVSSKRPGNLAVANKSQTLPRNLGSKNAIAGVPRQPIKTAATPPAVRRQFVSIIKEKNLSYILLLN